VGINQLPPDDNEVLPEIQLKQRGFGILAIIQVEKCYVKVRTSLTKHFATILNANTPTIWTTKVYSEAHLL